MSTIIFFSQCLYFSLHSGTVMFQHNVINTFVMLKHLCGNILQQCLCQKQSKIWYWAEFFVECSVGEVGAHGGILVQAAAHSGP